MSNSNFGDMPKHFSQASTATFGPKDDKSAKQEPKEQNKKFESQVPGNSDRMREFISCMREQEDSKQKESRLRKKEGWDKVKEGFNAGVIGNVFYGYIASGQFWQAFFIAMIAIFSFCASVFWNVFIG